MINSSNIKAYINFLHLKKYSAPATEDLKTRWAAVPEYEIGTQLTGLYQHWGIDPATASVYEQMFLQQQVNQSSYSQPQQPSYQQPSYQQPAGYAPPVQQSPVLPPGQPRSKAPLIIGAAVLLVLVGAVAFFLAGNRNGSADPDPAPATTNTPVKQADAPEQNAVAPPSATNASNARTVYNEDGQTETDGNESARVDAIRSLLQAEENRNMGGILDALSSDMEQYWDIRYPTQEELVKRYNSVWTKSSDGKHNHIRIDKLSDNTYDMYADYEFYSNKDQVSKAVDVHVRYVFDENNKIIKTFGVK